MLINNINHSVINKAVEILRAGGVISFPTETVYALACAYDRDAAIKRIYDLKGRDFNKPLAILASSIDQIEKLAILDINATRLLQKFSPGPLTIVVNLKDTMEISHLTNVNKKTIGMRIPDHVLALKIIENYGKPIIATSANLSNHADNINANSVFHQFGNNIDLIIDGGEAKLGIGSTVVDLTDNEIKILRIGSITEQQIFEVINRQNNE